MDMEGARVQAAVAPVLMDGRGLKHGSDPERVAGPVRLRPS